MAAKTVLLTGAGGYIGLHLASHLTGLGYRVIRASRSGREEVFMDFTKPSEVARMQLEGVDAVVHAVSPHESLFKSAPYAASCENAAGIKSILDFSVNNGAKQFIYLSSFHVFGDPSGVIDEATPPGPCSDYGLAHWIAEQTVMLYTRQGKLDGCILRPSNVYGVPKDFTLFSRWSLIPFAFCRSAVTEHTIRLNTPGHQRRNFVHVEDVCRRVAWLLEHPKIPVLHAYGTETPSVREFAVMVSDVGRQSFQLPVDYIIPDGENREPTFEFTSRYPQDPLPPYYQLRPFIHELYRYLLDHKRMDDEK